MVFVDFLEVFKVNEVIDYFDIVMDIEVFIGLLFEVFRYCSDIIWFIDGESYYWCESVVIVY